MYRLRVVGEDVHRGELARAAFEAESPSIAGTGGTEGQVWTRGSSDTNADWADAASGGGYPDLTRVTLSDASTQRSSFLYWTPPVTDWTSNATSTTETYEDNDFLWLFYSHGFVSIYKRVGNIPVIPSTGTYAGWDFGSVSLNNQSGRQYLGRNSSGNLMLLTYNGSSNPQTFKLQIRKIGTSTNDWT